MTCRGWRPQPHEQPTEHQVVVVFDVTAQDPDHAYVQVAEALRLAPEDAQSLAGFALRKAGVESWFFPHPDFKWVDDNDNMAGHLVFEDGSSL